MKRVTIVLLKRASGSSSGFTYRPLRGIVSSRNFEFLILNFELGLCFYKLVGISRWIIQN